jgi:protein-S-isoprenylcysteine O-methyltransferase Ste14
LFAYGIYVWSTIALGFKFSNLTNRGIVTTGPYAYVRHPAYASKNTAWIIDSTFVFTNIWATLLFFSWTTLYALRALTEERHLHKDKAYQVYADKVRYRFIPKVI